MAYDASNLSALTYANGFTLWHYKSPDVAIPQGYFNKAASMLRPGDFIFANFAGASVVLTVNSVNDGQVALCDIANTLVGTCE